MNVRVFEGDLMHRQADCQPFFSGQAKGIPALDGQAQSSAFDTVLG
jgi:hypothetical protein